MSDPGLTSEQRAAIAVHNATQNRMCLNLSGNGQICVACSEVADQIDAAVEVERQRGQVALTAARRECAEQSEAREAAYERIYGALDALNADELWSVRVTNAKAALAAPAAGEEGKHGQ